MSLFLLLMIAGLAGMLIMAIPGIFHANGGVGHATGSHISHIGDGGHNVAHVLGAARSGGGGKIAVRGPSGSGARSAARFIPSPRVVFSLMTAYGAFGYGCKELLHMSDLTATFAAILPAVLLERLAVTPLWNFMLKFAGEPCVALSNVVMGEAKAVTEFRNGRGMVSVEHDGRMIQLRAEMVDEQRSIPVVVGETLEIETIDEATERATVRLRC